MKIMHIKSMVIRIIFILYIALITTVSLMPSDMPIEIHLWDKGSHFIAYFIFTVLASGLSKNKITFFFISISIIIYSGLIEIAQSAIPGRMASAYDLLANSIGVATSILVVLLLKWFLGRKFSAESGSS